MKKLLLVIFGWASVFSLHAQNVNIPDANFKAALLANTLINTVDDGEISVAEAEAFTGTMDVIGLSIADFTGLEAFINLDVFSGGGNPATSIDVSSNTALTRLEIYNVPLSSLNVSNNINLDYLQFGKNSTFTTIDLSNNASLRILSCPNTPAFTTILGTEALVNIDYFYIQGCSIESLDLSKCIDLNQLRAYNNNLSYLNVRNGINEFINLFEIQNNPNLTCVSVDDPAYAEANWTDKDVTAEYKLYCDPNELVLIPDANFKAALVANDNIDTNMDDEISFGEAEAYTGTIDVNGLNITDLTGIESFTNITTLWAFDNSITEIDLSNNTEIVQLILNNNDLGEIDLAENVKLVNLQLSNCGLSNGLDVSDLVNLVNLNLNNNDFTTIDVSNNTALRDLRVEANNLSSLDISQNSELRALRIGNNSISDLNFSVLTNITTLYLDNNDFTSIDVSGNSTLHTFSSIGNQLTELNMANGNNVNFVAFNANNNSSLTCITVDDVSYSETNWTDIDGGVTYSTDCSIQNSITDTDILNTPLYPNPVSNELYIETQINTPYKIQNLFGETVVEGRLTSGTNHINVSELEEGLYLLVPEGANAHRFVKH